jgi:hypothetical protein
MASWLDEFKRDDGDGPPDGEHTAFLERAALRDTRNGKAIKCEWRTTDLDFWWESWHNTTGGGKQRTQQLLADLGIDLDTIASEEQLEDALVDAEDAAYIVKVSHSQDGRFINTAVVEKPDTVQEGARTTHRSTASDIPADTRGLPERTEAPRGKAPAADLFAQEAVASANTDLFGDDDIPF